MMSGQFLSGNRGQGCSNNNQGGISSWNNKNKPLC